MELNRKYFEIVSANKDFYSQYLSQITTGGSLNGENNIDNLRQSLLKEIEEKNKIKFPTIAKAATIVNGLGSGTIALVSAMTVVAAPLKIFGAALAISATLTGLINSKNKDEQLIISVFHKLHNA